MKRFAILAAVPALLLLALPSEAMKKWRLPPPDEVRPEVGCEFPDFPLTDTEGNVVWFNDYRGRPLLVAFCSCYTDSACAIIDSLEKVRSTHGGGLMTIIVCCETAPALAADDYAKLRQECRDAADLVLVDPLGETVKPFRVEVMPTAYLIDGDFCVRQKLISVAEFNAPGFRENLETVLDEYPWP